MLLKTGRYLLSQTTEEGKKIHVLSRVVDNFPSSAALSHNQYLAWKWVTDCQTKEEWQQKLIKKMKKVSEKHINGYIDYLLAHKYVIDWTEKEQSTEAFGQILLTRNGIPILCSETEGENFAIISDSSYEMKHSIELTEEQYLIYTAALGDDVHLVIGRIQAMLGCGEELAKQLIHKYIHSFVQKGLWTVDIAENLPHFAVEGVTSEVKLSIGFPCGIMQEEGVKPIGGVMLYTDFIAVENLEDYHRWVKNDYEHIEEEGLKDVLFSAMDEKELYLIPQGHFVNYHEETEECSMQLFHNQNEEKIPAALHMLWKAAHPNLSLSVLRIVFEQTGLPKEEIDGFFEEGIQALTISGFANLIKRPYVLN